MNILFALRNSDSTELGLNDLSRITSINKGTIFKILPSLIERNMVVQNEITKKYRLGIGLIYLVEKVYSDMNIYEISHPIILKLAKETEKTVTLGIKQKDKLVFIDCVSGNESTNFYCKVGVGESLPFYKGAAPKACFAHVDDKELEELIMGCGDESKDLELFIRQRSEIKKNGFSISDAEVDVGVLAIGAPIFNHEKKVIGGIAIAGIKEAFSDEDITNFSQMIKRYSKNISQRLGSIHLKNS